MWTSSHWGAIALNTGQGRREKTRMGSAGPSRAESSISVGKQTRNGSCSCCRSLLRRRTWFGICEMFLTCPEMLLWKSSWCLQTLPLQTLAPLRQCYNAPPTISTPHWAGLLSAGSFDRAAAMLAPATSTEASPVLIMSFHWLKGTSAGLNSSSSVAD